MMEIPGARLRSAVAGLVGLGFVAIPQIVRADTLPDLYVKERNETVSLTSPYIRQISRRPFLGVLVSISEGPDSESSALFTGAPCMLDLLQQSGKLGDFSSGTFDVNNFIDEADGIVEIPTESIFNGDHVDISIRPSVHLTRVRDGDLNINCTEPMLDRETLSLVKRFWGATKRDLSSLFNFGRDTIRRIP